MKVLAVYYTPRGEMSYTKKLLDTAIGVFKSKKYQIDELDLIEDVPELFLKDNLMAYVKRNFMGQELSSEESLLLKKMDANIDRVKASDIVLLAYPMYNFSMPAVVKAWFDNIIFAGQTFGVSEKGYKGLLTDKKALVLTASGGIYEGDHAAIDHSSSLARIEFDFMGFNQVDIVKAHGVNAAPDNIDNVVAEGQKQLNKIIDGY